jgi:hypothetical protein
MPRAHSRSRLAATYARSMAVNRSRKARAARRRKRRMNRVEHDLSDEQMGRAQNGVGAAARTAARRTSRCNATACSRSPVAGVTRLTTSCRSAAPATPASATTRSPVGCAGSGSTSAPSCCATWRSARRSRCGSKPSLDPLDAAQTADLARQPSQWSTSCSRQPRPRPCPRRARTTSSTDAVPTTRPGQTGCHEPDQRADAPFKARLEGSSLFVSTQKPAGQCAAAWPKIPVRL